MHVITSFINRHMTSFIKFSLVGTCGLVIDFAITWCLRDMLGLSDYLSSCAGFVTATASNYYLNSKWTFESDTTASGRQFLLFFIISLAGLGLHIFFLGLFLGLHISFYMGKLLAIACVLAWNFTANNLVTFRRKKIETYVTIVVLLLMTSACQDHQPAGSTPEYTVSLDSTLGLGNKFQTLEMPGRIIAFNPDSANKLIIIDEKGKIVNTVYKGNDASTQPLSIRYIALDADAKEIYIYSPQQHLIFVYGVDGKAKHTIPVSRIHDSGFAKKNGNFAFPDTAGIYVLDSTGKYIDSL